MLPVQLPLDEDKIAFCFLFGPPAHAADTVTAHPSLRVSYDSGIHPHRRITQSGAADA